MSPSPSIAEGEHGSGASIQLERIWTIWSRRKWLAILAFALPFAASVAALMSLPSLYRSTATVLVERQQVPESFVRSTVTSELETRLQTIRQEILSRARLEALIARFGLYADLRGQVSSDEIVARMRRDILLESRAAGGDRRATVAFALSYRGRDPHTVALVTNTLASLYIEENLKARERQATGTTQFLQTQIAETKRRLDEQERRMSEFKRQHLGELPQQMTANLTTLETLNTQLRLNSDNQVRTVERRATLSAQLAEAEVLAQTPGAALVVGSAGGPAAGPEPPALHLARLKQELTAARTRYTDLHPTVSRLKEEIAAVERDLASGRLERPAEAPPAVAAPVRQAATSPYVLRLREALQAADTENKIQKGEEQRLRASIAAYQARVENTPRREQEFQDITRDHETTREAHQSLVKRHEEAQLAESMEHRQKGESFRVLDPALPSSVTAAPNRGRLLLVALALSVGLAVAAAFLAEVLDSSFHSVADLRSFTAVPVLGSIPRIVTEADRRRRRRTFRLAAVAAGLALAVVVAASHHAARENENLVRVLDGERA